MGCSLSSLKQSNRKLNKIWVDKGSEFYNASFKKWLQDNIVMYSTHNERKSVVAERFIITLKSKIHKHMTSIPKNMYIDKLDDIVDEYNNTYVICYIHPLYHLIYQYTYFFILKSCVCKFCFLAL